MGLVRSPCCRLLPLASKGGGLRALRPLLRSSSSLGDAGAGVRRKGLMV